MPDQSAGGSLTERPPQPRLEHPAAAAPGAPVADAPAPDPAASPVVSGAGAGSAVVAPSIPDDASHGDLAVIETSGSPVPGQLSTAPATAPPGESAAYRLATAIDGWRRSLAGSGLPDTLLVSGPQATASWLDLTHTHPSGLAQLFAARPTRLASLFREPDAHAVAYRQARSIRQSAMVLSAQRGVQGCCLAVGVASWRPQASGSALQAPIVLRGCAIRPHGAGDDDLDLDLDDAVLINPELVRELVETYGIEADGAHLAALAHGEKGFDPRPVYAWLEERCRSLRAFSIERSLVLATFAAGSGGVLADLDAAVPAIAAHRLLGRVATAAGPRLLALDEIHAGAGDLAVIETPPAGAEGAGPLGTDSRRLALVGRLGPRAARPAPPAPEPDPAAELLLLDCDPTQHQALTACLRGEDVVIEGPPGSGATHALAAAIGGLVAAGRRVLVLSPRRASTSALMAALDRAGIGDLVLDLRDGVEGRAVGPAGPPGPTGAQAILAAALATVTTGPVSLAPAADLRPAAALASSEPVATIRRCRQLLDGSVEALHQPRAPWGISAYDAMVALCDLTGRSGSPAGTVRLPDAVLSTLDAVTRERLRVHLHAAAGAGAFTLTRVDTRWYDAQVSTPAQARTALEAAMVLRAGLERARSAMTAVTAAAGLRPAAQAGDWPPLLELLLGVRAVVDVLVPQTYDQSLADLAAALAPRGRRGAGSESEGAEPAGRGERRRLRRQAQALVRPGVHVVDLHGVLLTAAAQRRRWQDLSITGDGPRVVVGLSEAEAAVHRVMAAIDVLDTVFAGTPGPGLRTLPLDELERRVYDLAGDTQGVLGQPRRARLLAGLAGAGLGDLVDDLRARRVGPSQIDAEFDLAWWSSVRDSIVRSDPRLARHDRQALQQAAADLRRAEAERVAAGAELVRAAVLGRAGRVTAAQPAQVRVLRGELERTDRRPRLVDLVRRCGDVLAALTPIWVMSPDTVAASLAPAQPGLPPIVDTVVVDDAGHIGLPEVVAALSRGAQVIVAGDRRRQAPPDSAPSAIEALAPFARACRLERDHRARDGRMLVPLAPRYPEGWQLTPGIAASAPLDLEAVPDGIAIPPPGEELPVSADAEVRRVVELVERHALRRPSESLAVVTLSERHAERIEEALRAQVADHPVLGHWLAEQVPAGRAEPFVVRPVQRALGVERDCVIVAIGLARTPHGRVLHRFGVLDGDRGAAALTTAISRSRNRTTVVCCFTAGDLIVDRLRTAGARLLRDVLLAAGGLLSGSPGRTSPVVDGLVGDLRDRLVAAGMPVRTRIGDGAWPLDLAVADPRVPGRMLVAVDLDGPAFAARPCGERELNRPAGWEQAGWAYRKVSAMDLFADPALEVARIRQAWDQAMELPLPPDAYALPPSLPSSLMDDPTFDAPPLTPSPMVDLSTDLPTDLPTDLSADLSTPLGDPWDPGPLPVIMETSAPAPGHSPAAAPSGPPGDPRAAAPSGPPGDPRAAAPSGPPRNPHAAAPSAASGPDDDDAPVLPDRSRDDSDEGWSERDPDDRDEELRRNRPPHWD